MTPNLRKLAITTLLVVAVPLAGDCLADSGSGGASPGFSWKPKPKPPPAPPPPAPIAIPMQIQPAERSSPPPPPPKPAAEAPSAAPGPTAAAPPPPPPPPPPPNGGAPLSGDQLAKLYQGMSSTARQALENLIKTKGIDGLSKMQESDARTTFGGMPSNVREEIQAKWDGLSDEQRVALKKLKPDDIKEMATSQAKEIVQASVAPIMKPVETAVKTTEVVVDKTKSVLKRSRDYVQKLIAKMTGKDAAEPDSQ